MFTSERVRWGAVAGMLGGLVFMAEALVFAAQPGGPLQGIVSLVALALTAAGLAGFHALQRRYGGHTGFYVASLGSLIQAVSVLASLLSGGGYLEGPIEEALFGIGFLVMVVGYVIYGAATLRANLLPRWCGFAFGIAGLQALLPTGEYVGVVVFGALWLALGYALWCALELRPNGNRA